MLYQIRAGGGTLIISGWDWCFLRDMMIFFGVSGLSISLSAVYIFPSHSIRFHTALLSKILENTYA